MKEVKKNLQKFNKIAKETGSVTLFVLIAVLFFVVILLTVYTSSKNTLNAQEKEIAKIQKEYDVTESQLNEAYSEKLEELNQDISVTFTISSDDANLNGKPFENSKDWTNQKLKVSIDFLAEGNPQNSKVIITDSTGTSTYNCAEFLSGNNIIDKNCTIKVIASNGTTTTTTKTVKVSRIDKLDPLLNVDKTAQKYLIKKGTNKTVTATIKSAEDAEANNLYGKSQIKTLRYIWTTKPNVDQDVTEVNWQELSKAGDVTATFDGGEIQLDGKKEETYYLLVEAIDNAGNSTKEISGGITVEEDTEIPTTPGITNPSNGNWTNKDVTITLQSKDNLELSHFMVKKDDGTWEKLADTVNDKVTITYKDEMDKTFTYKAVDTSGNESVEMTTIVRIDKTKPTVPTYKAFYSDGSGNYTSGTWINKEVRTQISANDNFSGTPGVHSGITEMYYSTNKTEWTKFSLSISNGVQNDNTDKTIYTGTEKWDLKNRNDTYYFKVKDQAGNESEISTDYNIKYDIDKSTITVNPTNVNAIKETKVTITVGETGGSGLASTNSYQYQISTSNTEAPTGTWLNYTSEVENTIGTGLTGTYYLWVKEIKDVATNTSQQTGTKVATYHVFGKYVFDNKAPTITFGTNGNTTYEKSQSTTVKATDNGEAGLDLNSLKYQWTQSTTAPEEKTFTQGFVNGETITKNTGTGNNWYLWILAKDKLGNTIITNSNVFYLDNTAPTTTAPTAMVTSNTVALMFNQADAHSGINDSTKQYGIRKKLEDGTWSKWSKWATDTQNTHLFKYTFEEEDVEGEKGKTINITKNTDYEIRTQVTDKAGNGPTISYVGTTKTEELNAPSITHKTTDWTNGNVTATITYPLIDYDGKEVTKQYSRDKGVTWINTEENPQIITPITENGTVWARIIDSTNQVSGTATRTIGNIDTLNPIINSLAESTIEWTKEDVTITGKATDAAKTTTNGQSGIIAYQFSQDGNLTVTSAGWKTISNTGANQTTQTQVVTKNGIWYFYVKDAAGNMSKQSIEIKNIDKTAPTSPTISFDSNYVSDGLVLQYDGRNNTGNGHDATATTWKDLSGNGNDGKVEGGTWIENGLSLDGINDRVVVPYNSSLAPNEYTIDIAIKKKAIVNNTRSILFVKWQGYTIELNPNNITVFGVNSSTGYLATPSAQALNSDYTITATYKNNYQQLYINGLLVAECTVNGSLAQTAGSLTIGSWGTSNYVNGDIYGVRMYNKALTDTEILKNYRTDLATLEKYTGQDTQITITGSYALSGINKYQYSTDNGATWKDYNKDSKPTITAEGTTNVVARAISNSKVEGERSDLDVKIDKTNPVAGTMTMKINTATGEAYNNNTWTNQNVYVSMNNGSDALSGHYQTTYSLDGGVATTTPQTITTEGTHTIIVTSIDNAGNKATNSYTIKIDHNNPTAGTMTMKKESSSGAVYASGTWSAKNVYVSMNNGSETVTDKQSGHKSTTYTITGPVTSTTSTTLTNQTTARILTNDGIYTITVITTDNAENTATNSYTVKIDQSAPTGLALTAKYTNSSGAIYSGAWTKENVYVTLTATDNSGSGIGNYEWYNGNAWTRDSLTTSGGVGTITFTAERNTTIKFRVLDVLGNVSGEVSQVMKIDKTAISKDKPTATSTSRTITAVFEQKDNQSSIANSGLDTTTREYAIKRTDSNTWGAWTSGGEDGTHKFTGLEQETSYDIKTRGNDIAKNGVTESAVTTISTIKIKQPRITQTDKAWTNETASITIDFPEEEYLTHEYYAKVDGESTASWHKLQEKESSVTFIVSENQTIYAISLEGGEIAEGTQSPTVPVNSGDIQISLTSSHSVTNIDRSDGTEGKPGAPIIDSLTQEPKKEVWTNGTVTITGKATDAAKTTTNGQSGIIAYQFSTSGSLTATSSGWVAITNTGAAQTTQTKVISANATWYFYVKDAAGNVSKQSIVIGNIDTTKPTVPTYEAYYTDGSGNYTSGTWTAKEVRTKITSTDTASGVSEIQYSTDKTNWTKFGLSVSNGVVSSKPIYYGIELWTLQTRNNTYYFRVKDVAGNYSDASNAFNIRYDITAPSIATVTAGTDTTYKDAITFTASDNVNIASYGISTSSTTQPTQWLSTTQLDLSGIETKTEYGATWAKVFYHNNVNGNELFASDAEVLSVNSRYKYSILGQLENFRNTSGKFEFLLQYPNDATGYNRWIQTDNPATTTIADGTGNETAGGYQAVHVDWTSNYWGGLTKSTNSGSTYIDGSVGHGNWYYAIGCKTKYNKGIPSYSGDTQTVTELWVRVDNLTQANKQTLTGKIGNITSNGTYYLWIKDHLGNVANKAVTVNKVDTTAPTISSLTANTTAWTNQNVTLTVAAADAESGLYATPYGWNQNTTWSAQTTNTVSSNGTYTTYVRNKIGNVSSKAITISNIDKTEPTVAFSTNGNSTYAKSQSTKVTVTDPASGVNTSSLKYQWTQSTTKPTETSFTTTFTNGQTITKSDVTGNNWYLWILAKDNAGTGNTIITRSNAFYLDNTIPTTPTISVDSNYTKDGLILQYDGRNNTGNGHSSTATTWTDLSGNNKNGVLSGGTWQGNGLVLDGADDGVNLGSNLKDLFKSNNTVEVRVKFDEVGTRDIIFGNYNNTHTINYEKDSGNGSYLTVNYPKSGNSTGTIYTKTVEYTLTYVFSKTEGTVKLYKDAILVQTLTSSEVSNFNYDFTDAWIGRDVRTGTTALKGTIYGTRAYTKNLTEAEILKNYRADLANSETYTGQNTEITISGSTAPSGIVKYQYSTNNGTTWNDYKPSSKPVISAEGASTLIARAVSNVSLISGNATFNIKIDKTAPTTTVPIGIATSSTITTTFRQTDELSGINSTTKKYAIKKTAESTWGAWISDSAATHKFTGLTKNTSYDIKTQIRDIVGNISDSTVLTISTKDITSPEITSTPTSYTNGNVTVTIGYSDEAYLTHKYYAKVNGESAASWHTATANPTTFVIAENQTINAVSSEEDQTSLTASRSVTNIDKLVPSSAGTGTVTAAATTLTLAISGATDAEATTANAKSGIKNYDFYIDGVLKATQTGTSYTFTGLTPNTSHTITWRARDNAGNVTTVSSSTTITKYTLVNTPTGLSATGGTTAQGQQITTNWSANGNAGTPTYELQMSTDGSTFANLYTGTALTYVHTGIAIGNNSGGTVQTRYYRLRVKNGDGVYSAYTSNVKGNTLASPTVTKSITSNGINSGTNNISLSWTAVPGANSYGISFFDGYTYRYRTIGNITKWNSNDANIYPTSSQISSWNITSDPFKWDGTGTDFSSSLNALYVKANASYTTYSYYNWIHIYAIDSSGRVSGGVWTGATSKGGTTVDADAPNSFTPTATSTTNSITLTGSTTDKYMTTNYPGSGIRGYTFSKDNGVTWTAEQAGTSYTFANLSHKTTYNLKMRAYDNKGNYVETSSISRETVELIPGTISFKKDNSSGASFIPRTSTTGTKVWINSNVYMAQTNGNAGTTTYTVKNSAGTVQTISSGILTIPSDITDTYTVTVTTTDGTNTVIRTYYIDADKKAPTGLALTAKYTNSSGAIYSGSWTKENVYVTLTATDNSGSGIGNYEWYNGNAWTRDSLTTSSGVGTITFTAERNTTIKFRVLDVLGNVSGEVTQLVKIDKTPITKTAPTLSETSSTITATFKQTDTASGVDTSRREYGIKESSSSTWKWESEATGENGQHKFTGLTQEVSYDVKTRGYDIAGNGVTESNIATVQTIKITQPIISTNPTAWTNGNVTVTITYPEETYLTHKYYAKVNGESTASWHITTANPTTFAIDENQTINAVSVEGAQTSLTESRQVTNIDKIAPTIATTQESNIDADFSKWTLSGGAYVDSSGQLVLPSGNANATSPFMPVDEKAWIMDVDIYATTAATHFTPNGGGHMGQTYYDSSYNSIVAPSNGYSGNGWAEQVPLNTLTHKTINGAKGYGYGTGVKYVKFFAQVGSSYSTGPVTYSNFKFTTYGQTNKSKTIKVTATDNASGISAIKWLAGSKTIADFASAGADITSTKQFEVTSNGTYTIYAKDKAGNQTVKVETVSGIDRIAPTITVTPTSSSATTSKSITITTTDTGGSGLAGGNSYQYYLSTNSESLEGGAWTTYTSGTATTIGSGLNGKCYLWVKEIRDGVSNVSTTGGTKVGAYHRFGPYVFDNTKPIWSYLSKTNTTTGNTNNIKKADTITITFKGTDTNYGTSSLAVGDITVKIGGVTASPTTKALSSATSITGGVQYTLTLSGLSGNGDLTFDIAAGKLTDAAGNTSDAATIKPSIYVDNTASHWEITDITINKK